MTTLTLHREPITVVKHDDNELILRAGRTFLQLSVDDLRELYAFASGKPTIQRYRAVAAPDRTETGE